MNCTDLGQRLWLSLNPEATVNQKSEAAPVTTEHLQVGNKGRAPGHTTRITDERQRAPTAHPSPEPAALRHRAQRPRFT